MSKLITRKPTGKAPWPMVLVEGAEKSGKSWAWASFTASPRVGRVVVCIVGETDGDAYAAIPGADYEIIAHDGSYRSILGQIQAASDELTEEDGMPPVLVLDNISSLWSQITDDAQATANERAARRNKGLAPTDDVQITMDLWNQAANRWRAVMEAMMRFRGIVIIVGRGKEVAALDGSGKPTTFKDYKVEGHKTLTFDVDVWIRALGVSGAGTWDAQIVGARSVKAGISPTMNRTLKNWSIEGVVFDLLSAGEHLAPERSFTPAKEDIDEELPKAAERINSTPEPPSGPRDYSDDPRHHEKTKWLYTLVTECGLTQDDGDRVREFLKDFRKVESWKHLSPEFIHANCEKLAKMSPKDGDNGEMSERASRILGMISNTPAPAKKTTAPKLPPQFADLKLLVADAVLEKDATAYFQALAKQNGATSFEALDIAVIQSELERLEKLSEDIPPHTPVGTPSPRAAAILGLASQAATKKPESSVPSKTYGEEDHYAKEWGERHIYDQGYADEESTYY